MQREEIMYYIDDAKFDNLLGIAERMDVDGWRQDEAMRPKSLKVIETFNGDSEGEREEQGILYDFSDDACLLRVADIYNGDTSYDANGRYKASAPKWYSVRKQDMREAGLKFSVAY